jgi:anaerobic sulfite reductase subunit C
MSRATEYKQNGFIEQKQKGYYAMRIRTRGGNMTSEQLRHVADLADKYAQGKLHFTTRQAVEMPWVPEIHYEAIMHEIVALGLLPAVCGPRFRTIVACPGAQVCKFGLQDVTTLAEQLDELCVGRELPAKTKLGISGCPNSCAKPQENDIGLQGTVLPKAGDGCVGCGACVKVCKAAAVKVADNSPKFDTTQCIGCGQCIKICPRKAIEQGQEGYQLYAGGKIGRFPQLGRVLVRLIPAQDAVLYIEAVLAVYVRLANKGERVAQMLKRIGYETFVVELNNEVIVMRKQAG